MITKPPCEHIRFGADVIETRTPIKIWEEDLDVPRDSAGNVVMEWYANALALLTRIGRIVENDIDSKIGHSV